MRASTTIQHCQTTRQKPPKIRNRAAAIDHATRVIYRVCCLAGSANLIHKIRADLDAEGVRAAMRKRDTAAVFDWLIAALRVRLTKAIGGPVHSEGPAPGVEKAMRSARACGDTLRFPTATALQFLGRRRFRILRSNRERVHGSLTQACRVAFT